MDAAKRRPHLPTLTELANRHRSDKGTSSGAPPHRYTYLYDLLFWPLRFSAVNLLEIGLARGGPEVGGPVDRTCDAPSVRMWLSYFPAAHIYGFDISDFSHISEPRFTFLRGDAGSATDLQRLSELAPAFDIIIDDGSHASYHQQLTFNVLYQKLAPGGLYIIEDLQWQPVSYEEKLPKVPKTAQFFRSVLERDEYVENRVLPKGYVEGIKEGIASFSFFGAFDGTASPIKLLVIRKSANTESQSPVVADSGKIETGPKAVIHQSDIFDEIIDATYRSMLERAPDPSGRHTARGILTGASLASGLERMLGGLVKSQEFRFKQAKRDAECEEGTGESPRKQSADCVFMQSSDQTEYRRLLEISSKTVKEYCRRQNFDYQSYLGVVRGFYPWHATFNRIALLQRLVEDGYRGWVCYLDADAFVADLKFDLRAYLSDKRDIAFIAAGAGTPHTHWNINAGVLLINLGHAIGRTVVREWHEAFSAISNTQLRMLKTWGLGPEDQKLLSDILKELPERNVLIERGEPPLLNYANGIFVKQLLRTSTQSMDERIRILEGQVKEVLSRA